MLIVILFVIPEQLLASDAYITAGSTSTSCTAADPCGTLVNAMILQESSSELHTVTFLPSTDYSSGVFDEDVLRGNIIITSTDSPSETKIPCNKLISIIDPSDLLQSTLTFQNLSFQFKPNGHGFLNSSSLGTLTFVNLEFYFESDYEQLPLLEPLLTSNCGSLQVSGCLFRDLITNTEALIACFKTAVSIDNETSFSTIQSLQASSALYANIPESSSLTLDTVNFSQCSGVPFVCGGAVEIVLHDYSTITFKDVHFTKCTASPPQSPHPTLPLQFLAESYGGALGVSMTAKAVFSFSQVHFSECEAESGRFAAFYLSEVDMVNVSSLCGQFEPLVVGTDVRINDFITVDPQFTFTDLLTCKDQDELTDMHWSDLRMSLIVIVGVVAFVFLVWMLWCSCLCCTPTRSSDTRRYCSLFCCPGKSVPEEAKCYCCCLYYSPPYLTSSACYCCSGRASAMCTLCCFHVSFFLSFLLSLTHSL